MDISNANVEPFRRQHDFHELINESLKKLTASVCHTVASLEAPNATQSLGDLIKAADPSWQFPPVWEVDDNIRQSMLGLVGRLGMISVWSALDDFCVGIEAEVARWESFAKVALIKHDTETEATQSRLEILLTRFGWRQPQQKSLLIVLRYFGAVRNCIAHRDSKASPALAALSASSELSEAYFSLSDSPQRTLPVFEPDVEILVHPKLALVYSHLGRLLAMQVNEVLVKILGVDGILNMAVAHVSTTERRAVRPPKTAEAILNCLLIDRYLVRLENKLEAPKRLRDLKLWDRFLLSA